MTTDDYASRQLVNPFAPVASAPPYGELASDTVARLHTLDGLKTPSEMVARLTYAAYYALLSAGMLAAVEDARGIITSIVITAAGKTALAEWRRRNGLLERFETGDRVRLIKCWPVAGTRAGVRKWVAVDDSTPAYHVTLFEEDLKALKAQGYTDVPRWRDSGVRSVDWWVYVSRDMTETGWRVAEVVPLTPLAA